MTVTSNDFEVKVWKCANCGIEYASATWVKKELAMKNFDSTSNDKCNGKPHDISSRTLYLLCQ